MVGVDLELEVDEIGQGVRQPRRAELVADLAALTLCAHEPATAQARQVVRHVRTPGTEGDGQVGRIRRPREEAEQDATARRVSERRAHPLQRIRGHKG